ncbi:sensor histidine kinase [Cohnella sp. OV330]|uniref:sensor histidine kinase n=1 Tax=Cohnella sp. OV330 TaxID=1855288 RepID=UPI0021015EC7|nr:sensor histidine kinase [Cohnella sp. OV330]
MLRTLNSWVRDRRIRTKIMLVYLPLLVLPFIVLGYTANATYSKIIVEKTANSFADNSALIINRLSGMLGNLDSCANMLSLNLNRAVAGKPASDEGFDLPRYTAITTQLSLARLVFPDVDSAIFVDAGGRTYGSHPRLETQSASEEALLLYGDLDRTNGINVWLPMRERKGWAVDPDVPLLTVGKKIVDINTGTTLGVLFLNMEESRISAVLSAMNAEPSASYFIADAGGSVVSSAREPLLRPIADVGLREWVNAHVTASGVERIGGERMLLAIRGFPQLGWKLVSATPLQSLTTDLDRIRQTLWIIAGICCFFAVLGALQLSKRIANPIVRLARSMKSFQEGDLDTRLNVESRDEMGLFATGFNEMTRRVKALLDNVQTEQRKKREYELALFQAQIKPHFLYNTLDVVYALTEMGRAKEAQRATKALADFYRGTLGRGREMITIGEELKISRDYLAIQHIRYADVFSFEIDVDPDIAGYPILKLTVQPLIENAIYHGLKLKPSKGMLRVLGFKETDCIVLQVIDNGAGISAERLPTLLRSAEADTDGSYGLRNVNERIRLSFGEAYGLQIDSSEGVGTTVTIRLPFILPDHAEGATDHD